MKRLKIYWIPVLMTAMILTLGSCQKFLDIKKNSQQAYMETAEDCQRILDNYTYMNTGYPGDSENSADSYYLNFVTYRALAQPERDIYAWAPAAIRPTSGDWQHPYNTTYYANLVLETVEKMKKNGTADAATQGQLRGSALFYRAFAFWNLAQIYAKPYGSSAATDPGIPLRLSSDINDKSVRGTVQGTYSQIVNDLKEAAGLVSTTALKPTQPTKAAAFAMLARVYLSMEDYPNALSSANAALAFKVGDGLLDYNLPAVNKTSNTAFTRFNMEVIFHAIMNGNDLINPGTVTAPKSRINLDLYNLYESNDLRKKVFFKANAITVSVPNTLAAPLPATNVSNVPDGTYRFTGNYEQAAGSTQFVGLAYDELYLIRAECYARAGSYVLAMQDINLLLKYRYSNATAFIPKSVADADVLNFVLTERRKELVMRGQRWTDLRRLNKDSKLQVTLVRKTQDVTPVVTGYYTPGNNPQTYSITMSTSVSATYTLPPNDLRYTLLIPQDVITFDGIAQNAR